VVSGIRLLSFFVGLGLVTALLDRLVPAYGAWYLAWIWEAPLPVGILLSLALVLAWGGMGASVGMALAYIVGSLLS
jgi:hypothetical protein